MHPRCRRSTAAYMDDEEYREWLDGYSKHGMDFETWKSAKRIRKRYKDNEKTLQFLMEGLPNGQICNQAEKYYERNEKVSNRYGYIAIHTGQ